MLYLYVASVILTLLAIWYGMYRVDSPERILVSMGLVLCSFVPMLNLAIAFSLTCIGAANRLYD